VRTSRRRRTAKAATLVTIWDEILRRRLVPVNATRP
jgi:hypothetical protein